MFSKLWYGRGTRGTRDISENTRPTGHTGDTTPTRRKSTITIGGSGDKARRPNRSAYGQFDQESENSSGPDEVPMVDLEAQTQTPNQHSNMNHLSNVPPNTFEADTDMLVMPKAKLAPVPRRWACWAWARRYKEKKCDTEEQYVYIYDFYIIINFLI